MLPYAATPAGRGELKASGIAKRRSGCAPECSLSSPLSRASGSPTGAGAAGFGTSSETLGSDGGGLTGITDRGAIETGVTERAPCERGGTERSDGAAATAGCDSADALVGTGSGEDTGASSTSATRENRDATGIDGNDGSLEAFSDAVGAAEAPTATTLTGVNERAAA